MAMSLWQSSTVQIFPSVIGMSYLVGEKDSTPLRRYVGFIGLRDEHRSKGSGFESSVLEFLELSLSQSRSVVYVAAGQRTSFPTVFVESVLRVIVGKSDVAVLILMASVEAADRQKIVSEFGPLLRDRVLFYEAGGWINQNEVLKHRSTRVFVTHGGYGGLIESIRSLTPMLVVPLAFDQHTTGARVVERRLGHRIVALQDLEEESIRSKLNDLLFERREEFVSTMHKMSRLSELTGEEQKAADVIEEVLLFGTDHLRVYYPFFAGLVLRFVDFSVIVLILVLVFLVIRCCGRLCCRCHQAPPQSEDANGKKKNE